MAEALETQSKIESEMVDLKEFLHNIETARPFEQITVDDLEKACPGADKVIATMVKRGQFRVPGYFEQFGEFKIGF